MTYMNSACRDTGLVANECLSVLVDHMNALSNADVVFSHWLAVNQWDEATQKPLKLVSPFHADSHLLASVLFIFAANT